jgi:hypothetical protein
MRLATTNEAGTRSVVQPTLCPSLNSRIPPTATLQAQACTTPPIAQDSANGEDEKGGLEWMKAYRNSEPR